MEFTKEELEELWFNAKTKIDFMKQVGIINRDYRACDRLLKKFNINKEDMGKNFIDNNKVIKPKNDLTGKSFGQIDIIEIDIQKSQKHKRTYYKCYCHVCNKICIKRTDNIASRSWNEGCGCKEKLKVRLENSKDLTENKYGKLTVIELDVEKTKEKEKKIYWKRKCDCGNTCSIESASLKYENTLSCGCYNKERIRETRLKDLTGQKFNRLTVIELDTEKMKQAKTGKYYESSAFWKCQCNCGNIITVKTYELCNGKTKSCGCYKADIAKERNLIDISGQRFGKLTAIKPIYNNIYSYSGAHWLCKCDCGNEKVIASSSLRNGYTRSCGCLTSRGEYAVTQILQELKLNFVQQFTFDNLVGINGGLLKFDFAVIEDNRPICLIEYNGKQHYSSVELFGGDKQFKIQQEHDKRKRDFCKNNNIKLIEIPYWDFDKINSEYILNLINN